MLYVCEFSYPKVIELHWFQCGERDFTLLSSGWVRASTQVRASTTVCHRSHLPFAHFQMGNLHVSLLARASLSSQEEYRENVDGGNAVR